MRLWKEEEESLPPAKHIRLLLLQPATCAVEPIVATLQVVSLESDPLYQALSYTWATNDGDASLSEELMVGDEILAITKNLSDCLRRLRSSYKPVSIWVDAVCINQQDLVEQSAQVAMMAEIYTHATEVLVWLGEGASEEEDRTMLRLLRDLKATWDIWHKDGEKTYRHRDRWWSYAFLNPGDDLPCLEHHLDAGEQPQSDDDHAEYITVQLQKNPHVFGLLTKRIDAVRSFFGRRYWTRRWVIQELTNARAIVLIWGPCQSTLAMEYDDGVLERTWALRILQRAVIDISSMLDLAVQRHGLSSTQIHPLQHREMFGIKNDFDFERIYEMIYLLPGREVSDMLGDMKRFSTMQCSDPRDRLYSLMSLYDTFPMTPDYRLALVEVYTKYARHMIRAGHITSVLGALGKYSEPDNFNKALPSWVPDLRDENLQLMPITPSGLSCNTLPCRLGKTGFQSARKDSVSQEEPEKCSLPPEILHLCVERWWASYEDHIDQWKDTISLDDDDMLSMELHLVGIVATEEDRRRNTFSAATGNVLHLVPDSVLEEFQLAPLSLRHQDLEIGDLVCSVDFDLFLIVRKSTRNDGQHHIVRALRPWRWFEYMSAEFKERCHVISLHFE